jgi:hypothetical protein
MPTAAANSSGVVGMHQLCNLTDLEFSSVLGQSVRSSSSKSLCKTIVPQKHGTAAQGFFTIRLPDHLDYLPKFWHNFTFSHC